MTLTPAFLPDDDISGLTADPRVAQALQDHEEGKIGYIRLLRVVRSVVAAEEGRKYEGKIYTKEDAEALCEVVRAAIVQHYEPLVKLHREWVEARKEERAASVNQGERWLSALDAKFAAESALAQWEAL